MLKKINPDNMDKTIQYREQISTVQFEVTNCCNLHCAICWRTLRETEPMMRHVSSEEFQTALDKLLTAFDIQELNTQGLGEPFLCPDIMRILRLIKSRDLKVWLVTNGTAINDTIARELIEIGVDKIRISIDSASRDTYAQIKSGSNLDLIADNIRKILHYKKQFQRDIPMLSLNSVVLRQNLHDLEDLIQFAGSLCITEISLIPLVSFGQGKAILDEQVDLESDFFQEYFQRLKSIALQYNMELNLGISMETKSNKFCHHGLYIDVYGNVHPCCNISQVDFGNIYKDSIETVVTKYAHFRKILDTKDIFCKECNAIFDK